jgi:predicted peptidase
MGGRGTWQLAVEHPERFAAIAPICGRVPDMPDFFERLAALRAMPAWVFHGARDEIIPIDNSNRMVAALRELGNEVRYKIYPEAGHDAWTATYANPELYEWFLAHRL